MSRVYYVRHVMALGNLKRTFQGRIETELVEEGERQLKCLEERFSKIDIDIIYASPISRAYKTAQAIKRGCNAEIICDERLVEIDAGVWEGMPIAGFKDTHPLQWNLWMTDFLSFRAPGGESTIEVARRMKEASDEIIAKNKGKNIVIVSHGAALRSFMQTAFGDRYLDAFEDRPIVANASISLYLPECDEIKYIDDCDHLKR